MRKIPDEEIPAVGLTALKPPKAGIAAFCLLSGALFAAGLSVAEKKAVRREMIEMDIAARNLTSIVATGDKKMLEDSLERLIVWQIKDHPEHGKNFRSALGRWENQGALKFGKQIQTEANAMRSYVQAHGKFSAGDWARIETGLTKILAACRGCHDITRKEDKP
ncbi:MAG: hypothetical protein KF713_16305 [Turneriella sp.]|nr:hypothetical protein [Turneriella sp.]